MREFYLLIIQQVYVLKNIVILFIEKYSTSCNSPLSFWLYGMAAIGFFVIVISLIGIFAVTYGQITGLQQNHVIRMSMLDDAGAELGEDEDPKYFNALEDPPQTVFENVNLTAGENLHLGCVIFHTL